jgi:hypothetical protein
MWSIGYYGTQNKNLTLMCFLLRYLHYGNADKPRCLTGLDDTAVQGVAFSILLPRPLLGVADPVVGEDEEGG